MNRIASAVSLLVGILLTGLVFAADPLVVDLWPGKSPGDVGINGQESSRMYESAIIAGPTKLLTNVTKPTLTIYLPDKEKNTGTAMLICPGGGYHNLFWELEGEEVAAWLNSIGVTGIILKYRVPRRAGMSRASLPWVPSWTRSAPSAWCAAGPRNGASTRSESARSASRRAAILR